MKSKISKNKNIKNTKEPQNFKDFITRFESFGNAIAFKYKENKRFK